MNDLVQSLISPFKAKGFRNFKFGFFFFFCLCPLPSFLRMSEAPYDATIAYVSLHGRPHRESPCFRSTLESSNSGAKCLIQDPPPSSSSSKTENVWTQYKMKPIPYPFLFCHQAFSCGRRVLRCRDCSFVLHLCCVIKGPILRTIPEYAFPHNNLWLQPVSELSSKEGSPSFLVSPSAIWLALSLLLKPSRRLLTEG